MAEEHAAGSWLGDLTNEWKTAKPPEKILILGAVAAVGGIALYLYKKQQGQNVTSPAGESGQPGQGTGQTSGYPTIPAGSIPEVPAGISPIFDPNGNLIGWGPTSSSTPSGTLPPSTGTPPAGTGSSGTGSTGVAPAPGKHHKKPHKHHHSTHVAESASHQDHGRFPVRPIRKQPAGWLSPEEIARRKKQPIPKGVKLHPLPGKGNAL